MSDCTYFGRRSISPIARSRTRLSISSSASSCRYRASKAINAWTLWTGASLLVASGLLSFAFQWRSVAKSFQALAGLFGKKTEENRDPLADIECPPSWFPLGFLVLGPVVVGLMAYLFQIPWWAGVIALPLAVVMGVIASRVTGETDTTPTKALGPVTQLLYGGLLPGNLTANIMSANATGGVGLHSADLLTDLKSGWLLGANPRQQFVAQLFGVVAGAAVVETTVWFVALVAMVVGCTKHNVRSGNRSEESNRGEGKREHRTSVGQYAGKMKR